MTDKKWQAISITCHRGNQFEWCSKQYLGVKTKWLKLNESPLYGKFEGFYHPNLTFGLLSLNGHLQEISELSSTHYSFRLPTHKNGVISWLSHDKHDSFQATWIKPGDSFQTISQNSFSQWTLSIHRELLEHVLFPSSFAKLKIHIPISHTQCLLVNELDSLHFALSQVWNSLKQNYENQDLSPSIETICHSLLQSLSLLPFRCQHLMNPPFAKKAKVVKKFQDFIEQHSQQQPRLIDFCRLEKISLRSLEYAVKTHIGLSPKKYMRAINLNRVRFDLLNSNHSINSIANRWGFWHMGQFSKDYKALFGELPTARYTKQAFE